MSPFQGVERWAYLRLLQRLRRGVTYSERIESITEEGDLVLQVVSDNALLEAAGWTGAVRRRFERPDKHARLRRRRYRGLTGQTSSP